MFLRILYLLACFVLYAPVWAQTKYIIAGRIEFERKTNLHALLDEYETFGASDFKKIAPKFSTKYYDLIFKK